MLRNLLSFMVLLASTALGQPARSTTNPVTEALSALAHRGISIQFQLYADALAGAVSNASGSQAAAYQFLDFGADLDLDRLSHLRGTHLYTSVHANGSAGGEFDSLCQSMIGISSSPGIRLAEFWISRDLRSMATFKAGLIDANTDFAFVNSATGFMNESFSYDPTFVSLPNFSTTAWGAELLLHRGSAHLNVAAFDPLDGTGTLLIEEGGLGWNPDGFDGRAAIGAWQQTGKAPAFSGANENGALGYYFVAEQKFWKRRPRADSSEQSLTAFLQLGTAPSNFSRLTRHFGAGITWVAPLAIRPHDSVGLAVTRGRIAHEPPAGYDYPAETVLETYYRFRLSHSLTVSPDLQYVRNPGGISPNRNVFAAGARINFSVSPKSE